MPATRVLSLGGEDSLEKEMATHSSILAWRIPRTEEPGGLQACSRVGYDLATKYGRTDRKYLSSLTRTIQPQRLIWCSLMSLPRPQRCYLHFWGSSEQTYLLCILNTYNTFICVHTEKTHTKKTHTITITFGNNTKACIWVPQWTYGFTDSSINPNTEPAYNFYPSITEVLKETSENLCWEPSPKTPGPPSYPPGIWDSAHLWGGGRLGIGTGDAHCWRHVKSTGFLPQQT